MDFRGNLEVGGPEDVPEVAKPGGQTTTPESKEDLPGITSGGKETEGEYNGSGY